MSDVSLSLEKFILNLIEELEHKTSKDSAMYETVHKKLPHSLVEIEVGIADYIKTHILSELRVSAEKIRSKKLMKLKNPDEELVMTKQRFADEFNREIDEILKELVEPSGDKE